MASLTPRSSGAGGTRVVPALSALAVVPAVVGIVLLFVSVGLAAATFGAYSSFTGFRGKARR